ncbi:hypothetical protein MAR_022887, partial [Mya arenaria]
WSNTSVLELQAYIALQIAMGINSKPKLADYWSTYWLTANKFSDVMSRNWYQLLNTLHFNDNDQRVGRGQEGYDPLFKFWPLLDIIDVRYTDAYATEINTGYGLRFLIYTGKNTFSAERSPEFSMTEQVCIKMMNGYENRGHTLHMVNFYSSPRLFQELKVQGFGACGTVRSNRKFIPFDMQPSALALDKGDDSVFMRTQDLITCTMVDTKRVISLVLCTLTIHSTKLFETKKKQTEN